MESITKREAPVCRSKCQCCGKRRMVWYVGGDELCKECVTARETRSTTDERLIDDLCREGLHPADAAEMLDIDVE